MLASATPVTRFVAPGPSVARHTPALPVSRPYTSAMKAAPCSWRVVMKRMGLSSRTSMMSMFSSPGMPKTYSTPSFSRQRTNSSAAFIGHFLGSFRQSPTGTGRGLPNPRRGVDSCQAVLGKNPQFHGKPAVQPGTPEDQSLSQQFEQHDAAAFQHTRGQMPTCAVQLRCLHHCARAIVVFHLITRRKPRGARAADRRPDRKLGFCRWC